MTLERTFGATSTTEDVLAGHDLTGAVALVTGASTGLGFETARALYAHGASVVLAARDEAKLAAAVARLGHEDDPRIATLLVDLGDLASVRRAASEARERFPTLDLLVNNAGVMACPEARTVDGVEWQFGVNHLGHFLFTCMLAPSLVRGAPARVVNLSSAGHKLGRVDFEDVSFTRRPYEKWLAYGQSKTANVLFTVALEARLGPRGVHAFAVHPGMIATELARHLGPEDLARFARPRNPPKEGETPRRLALKDVRSGAATTVFAAVSASLAGRGGLYLEDCAIAEIVDRDGEAHGCMRYALDPDDAERLWALSEQLVGEAFPNAMPMRTT